MTLLVSLIVSAGIAIGFFVAWHWQRVKYEKILKVLGDGIRAAQSSSPS
jgi:hypothetical protein